MSQSRVVDPRGQVVAGPGVGEQVSLRRVTTKVNELGELRVRNDRGEWRWLEAITTNLLDDKNVQALVTNSRDVTGRVETTPVVRGRAGAPP